MCVARYGVAAQIASGLGTALRTLSLALEAEGAVEKVAIEDLLEIHVQKDQWSEMIVLRLTTTRGIPYIFQFHSGNASEIADRLRTEGAKPTRIGNA